ncbi:unnamed protein product [Closterium sp. NIES-54]
MDVACTSMIHATAPHFLWPFVVQYAAHQLNLQPQVSMPETSPTLQWTGRLAMRLRSVSEDLELSSVTCLRTSYPPVLFLASSLASPLTCLGPAPSGVSQVDAVEPVEVAVDFGTSGGAEPTCKEPGGAGSWVFGTSGGAEPERAEAGGAGSGGTEPESAEPWGAGSGGAEPGDAVSEGAEPAGAGHGGPSGALSRWELPSPQELRKWFARRWSRAAGAGGTAGAGGSVSAGGAGATSPGGARTGGTGAVGRGGATGARAAGAAGAGGAAESSGGTAGAGAAVGAGGTGAGGAAGAGAAESSGSPAGAGAAMGAGGTGAGGAAGAGAPVGAGVDTTGAAGGTARAGGTAGVGADAVGAVSAGAVSAGSGGAMRPRPYFVPLLEQVLGLPPSSGPTPSLECPPPIQSESQLQLASPLPAPSPYTGPTGGLAERRELESRPASPVRSACTSRRVPRQHPPAVPSTHQMALRPSTASQRVPLPSPPASSLPALADPESDSLRAASPTVMCLLATVVTDPILESTAASALVGELVDFAAHCRLDYAASLVTESASVCPPSVGGECALSTDVLEDRQEEFQCFAAALPHLVSTLLAPEGDPDAPDIPTPRSYAEAIEGPYSSQWQAAMDAEMASWKSTGTYVDEVPPPGANIVSGMWIFRVKGPPGSPPVFKACYVARGFSQRQGVDYFQTFSPTPKMTTLRVLLHVAAHRDYDLHSLDFSTAFLQGSLHEEIWLRRPPGFTGSFPASTQWSLWRPVYGLRQAPCEWHDTLRTTLAALGFAPSTADLSLFLRTDTLLSPFYILVYLGLQITRDRARRTITLTQSHMVQQVLQRFEFTYSSPHATPLSTRHSLSALPSDESVEPSGPYPELVGCLMSPVEPPSSSLRSPPGASRVARHAEDYTCGSWKRHTCTNLGELRSYLGLQITRDRARRTITLTQSYMVHQVLQRFGFQYSSPQPTPLSTSHSLSAPPSDESVELSGPYPELVGCLITSCMGLVLGGRGPVVLTGHANASWVDDSATQRSSQGYTFSLGSGSISWRSTRSSSVLSSSCEAEIYAGAMVTQELRWLTYLLTDLGEQPRSPPILYIENKAMIALCQEHRLEHRTKHIALRYFLARELQQRGQLRLAYVATRANTADVSTKALLPGDHQRFVTVLGLVPTLPHLLTA